MVTTMTEGLGPKKWTRGRSITIALVAAGALLLTACTGAGNTDSGGDGEGGGENISITFASGFGLTSLLGNQIISDFFIPELEARVAAETPHTITVEETWGSLISPGEEADALESGLADMGTMIYSTEATKFPLLALSTWVPFQSTDLAVVTEAWARMIETTPSLLEPLEAANIKPLAYYGTADYGIAAAFDADSPQGVSGHRVGGQGVNLVWVDSVGAVGVQSFLTEAYTNLQTGVMEGYITYASGVDANRLYEVTDYFLQPGFGAALQAQLAVNTKTWDSLPEDVQVIVEELAAETQQLIVAETMRVDNDVLTNFPDADVEVVTFDETDRKAWADELPNLPEQWIAEKEAQGLEGAREAITAYIRAQEELGYEFPRNWIQD